MKQKYIDQYGIDSLVHLKIASANRCDYFVTTNESLLQDKEELEKIFKIKIARPEELGHKK